MDFDSAFPSFDASESCEAHERITGPAEAVSVALVSTFPPRQCGLATFASDLVEQTQVFHPEIDFTVFALDNGEAGYDYPQGVRPLGAADPAAYRAAAEDINANGTEVVWLHHEYGIFGGPDGEMVCDFVERLAPPLVLTLHTVLTEPSERQRAILEHLLARASRVMVMSRHSKALLCADYGAPGELVEVIEHGAPDRPRDGTVAAKSALGLEDRPVAMTFGLLGPGKGLEHVIDALPGILMHHPEFVYRIVGATHPTLAAHDGESYREMLVARARDLGVDHAIEWENRYLDTDELLDRLAACDIFVTPYPNLQQSTSGTLSYAVALGKAVVATPYIHARELLADGVGVLVAPNSATALAEAIIGLLDDRPRLAAMQKKAWQRGRSTIWPRFADAAARLVRSAIPTARARAPLSVTPHLDAVFSMSDATGMLQHAIGVVPDRSHGYCLDDNVRALMLMNVAPGLEPGERSARAVTYASFIQHAWNPDIGRFRNFMRFDRTWCEDEGSEDSNGRTLWALGQTLETSREPDLRAWARRWYDTALEALATMSSPRARTFVMLGAAARLKREPDHALSRKILAEGAEFLAFRLSETRSPHWPWFETRLGYDNPRLCQALLEAGQLLDNAGWRQDGLETARWLASIQSSAEGVFRPVGSDSLGRDREVFPFDQQPLEAHAAIDVARAAFACDGDPFWIVQAQAAWRWFFGANDRGAVLADLPSGRCRDGINPRGRNENCGAESILALHLARHSMLALNADTADDSAEADIGRTRRLGIQKPANPLSYL
ncbi:glycosyltransferase family 4 protein [Qipengyuania sp.]|uniref:glycosyltransferase family 4 protein n=1 Tax=Qipengyuania sp. TaxID=2004515 RepID=UPI0035C839B2